jgi:hypothetical protein
MSKTTDNQNNSVQASPSRLALLRVSRWVNLAPETLEMVRQELLESMGLNAGESQVGDAGSRTPVSGQKPAPSAMQIRKLLTAGAPWHVVSQLLWQDYNASPTPERASRLLETAFVQATPTETLTIFTHLLSLGNKSFYWNLHPKLRDFIVEHAPEQNLDALYWILARERNDAKLSGIELAYIFLRVATTSDKTAAWMYFRRHQNRILDAFNNGRHFGMTQAQLMFRAGELALGQGYTEDAREVFNRLPSQSQEREIALQMLLRFESHTVDRHKNSYVVRLEGAQEWQERLDLISSFCDTCRLSGGLRDPNRPALDIIVGTLLQWIPKGADTWRAAGDLIYKHRDLASTLPGLFKSLVDQSLIFHGPDIDGGLWSAAIKTPANTNHERFFQAVGLLHRYVTSPRTGERGFWTAHMAMQELENAGANLPWTWKELLKTANQWVNQTTFLIERDRKRACAAIKLAQDSSLSGRETFETYMTLCEPAPQALLYAIARTATNAGLHDYATSVLIRSGLTKSFSNNELLHIWTEATYNPSPDLAWRVATVLASRDALPGSIKPSWEISGEKRNAYTPLTLTPQDVECALSDLPASTRKLALALCVLGLKINELALLHTNSSQHAPVMSGTSSMELAVFNAFKTGSAIARPSKSVVQLSGIHMIPSSAIPLTQAIINGPWLFAARLIAERLSITSWGWSVTVLQHHVREILPYIGKENPPKSDAKTARWLASMSSAERAAWNDIMNCTLNDAAENISNNLLKFVCRLAIIAYPAHFNALKTAQQIRLPLDILRDMEWFVLCEPWSAARSRNSIAARVAIPESLKRNFT